MTHSMVAAIASGKDYDAAIELLVSQKLPVTGIDKNLSHFFSMKEADNLIGIIGLELFVDYGLIRSMATSPFHRNNGIATALLTKLLVYAKALGLEEVFLLTETATVFFLKKGFRIITREEAPDALKQSSEFTHLCPSSAILMKKEIA